MESLKGGFFRGWRGALLGALLALAPAVLRADGPIPTDAAGIEAWVAHWPDWKRERQRLDGEILRLRERLKQQGEAEASGPRPPWWDLPSRQRQDGRLRFLHGLRVQLEQAQERRFQVEAVEALWKTDLQARRAKGKLAESLKAVLGELEGQAEKDSKDKGESI